MMLPIRSSRSHRTSPQRRDAAPGATDESGREAAGTLKSRWGVKAAYDRKLEKSGRIYLNPGWAGSDLPPEISRHSAYYFDDLSPD